MSAALVSFSACSNAGLRAENQDSFVLGSICSPPSIDSLEIAGRWSTNHGSFAVIDGIGGYSDGAFAAAIIADELAHGDEPRIALSSANARLYALDREKGGNAPGAVCTGIHLTPHGVQLFSVGDTRAYHYAGGIFMALTNDDVDGSGLLTASIGGRTHPTAEAVTTRPLDLRQGDRLLLCTDGVSGPLPFDALGLAIEQDASASELVRLAVEAGSRDNATAWV